MNDTPSLSHALLAPRGHQQPRTTSDSPTGQRFSDDFLANLTPRTAVDALRNPSGALKACIDTATPSEQAFAMRTAVAAKSIQEWVDDLSAWPWPAGRGSAGFEMPVPKRRRLFQSTAAGSSSAAEDEQWLAMNKGLYLGSLPTSDVALFERRIDEISQSMEELDVEEIKNQVLHNHIMPLSRPGSPMVDPDRSVASSSSLSYYARMDDLTAMITATVMQTLPNLSRLTRLLNVWNLRLAVLRMIPALLTSLDDAEVAIQSGWNAIVLGSKSSEGGDTNPNGAPAAQPTTLSRNDFEVMKSVLERKVAKAGRDLDAMLDMLEGTEDTLPEEWIDRMDALERGYGEWAVFCERKIREADCATSESAPKVDAIQTIAPTSASPAGTPVESSPSEPLTPDEDFSQYPDGQSELLTSVNTSAVLKPDSPPVIKVHFPPEEPSPIEPADEDAADERGEYGAHVFQGSQVDGAHLSGKETHYDSDDGFEASELAQADRGSPKRGNMGITLGQFDFDFDLDDASEAEVLEPELPVLPRPRRGSDMSNTSTIVHGLQSGFMDFSSDQLDYGTPEIARLRNAEPEAIPSDDGSPPSSPPAFRSSTRSLSVSFNDTPAVIDLPDYTDSPKTPLKSFLGMDRDRETGSPSKSSPAIANADDQLQQQISEILENLPTKIRLTSEPTPINLNPPDFTMPTRKAAKHDYNVRSHSSLSTTSNISSRAGTPSFTLAPAFVRNSRPRHGHQRGNSEIKLYHLSRSSGEPPIKLFIRCVGERGERVMVRVGGGWADLGEYLKEYASHHGRRSGVEGKVEIKDLPRVLTGRATSTPPSRPASAQDLHSPVTPLNVRKSRRPAGDDAAGGGSTQPKTPLTSVSQADSPSSGESPRSRSSSRLSWAEEESSLGMAGPRAKQIEMSEESKAWVESVKEKVRIASGERKAPEPSSIDSKFGEIGKVGATKRLFRRQG
ncbi:hypothetical protein B0T26DRAFT_637703 [Lasiosphaeria miniovina]|uniref:GAR domain-containing protein n=1 Tax=Lasiosphaeria miniovina TaxID=1954250 RepID=A0AA40EAA7_9PEZI|nr:uncharacterized protein B0T26DRAFT_637703 [Lasiosphaeria miniovina]KAK0728133.1 hypothetical protein B0T26DRAFT_637703 [Lasiosphaeria miniovina]